VWDIPQPQTPPFLVSAKNQDPDRLFKSSPDAHPNRRSRSSVHTPVLGWGFLLNIQKVNSEYSEHRLENGSSPFF